MENEFEEIQPMNSDAQQPIEEVQETRDVLPQEEAQQAPAEPSPACAWGYTQPKTTETPVPAQPLRERKKGNGGNIFRRVVAVILLVCLSVAGGYVGANLENWLAGEKDTSPVEDHDKTVNQVDVLLGTREDTRVNIHEVDTGKEMTPAEVYATNVNATVGITTSITTNYWGYSTTSAASGSGFVYSSDGYIVTNYHVVEGSNAVTVSFYDGKTLDARIIGYDENNDVAVLKVEATGLVPVILGDSDKLNVGDPVVAIGNPLGELTFSLTSGAVSALGREITFSDGLVMSLIQTDCAINSGNSGGALFNLYGEVVGITNAKYSGSSGSGASIDNIGFAIPINRARGIVDSIIEKGYAVKPYIGVTMVDVSQETQSYGLPAGASIRSVLENSPAEKAGLMVNDIVTHVNGEAISGSSSMKMIVSESTPGDVLKLTLWREGRTMELELTVGEQIQSETTEQENQSSGNSYNPFFPFN